MTQYNPSPLLDGDWEPIPELTDKFEGGKLDPTKWHDHNPGWMGAGARLLLHCERISQRRQASPNSARRGHERAF